MSKNDTNNTLMNDFDRNVFEKLENIEKQEKESIQADMNESLITCNHLKNSDPPDNFNSPIINSN